MISIIRSQVLSIFLIIFMLLFGNLSVSAQSATSTTSISKGWNLLGNGTTTAISLANTFNDPNNVTSIWKWDSATSAWAYYSPSSDSGVSYAKSQGYETLTTIQPGEGYWVNAASSFSINLAASSNYSYTNFKTGGANALPSGWSLISIGDGLTASQFNASLGSTSSSSTSIPLNTNSIWAWDNVNSKWYYYSPSYDASGQLNSFINTQGYESFSVSLVNGVGFWVSSSGTSSSTNSGSSTSNTSGTSTTGTSTTGTSTTGTSTTASGSSSCNTSNPTLSSDPVYYAPASYEQSIQTCIQRYTLTAASSLASRSYFMLSDASTDSSLANYLQIGSTYSATSGFTVTTGVLGTSLSNSSYLSKLVQAVSDSYGNFRFDSQFNPNNSLDYDSSNSNILVFRDNFALATKFYGYVTFAYDNTTNLLQAKNRYTYSLTPTTSGSGQGTTISYAQTWTLDTAFTAQNYYVSLNSGVYKLVQSASNATKIYLYNSPISFNIPSILNPLKIAYDTSSTPAPFIYKASVHTWEGTSTSSSVQTSCPSGSICSQISSKYKNQLLFSGSSSTTKVSADAMLASIKTAVEASGEKLRYPVALYTAFRDQALATKLVSDSVSDGTPGQNLVPYIYYTNEQDSLGKYHPFMIIVSYANQPSPNGLRDVPQPPGAPSCSTYDCRTRTSNLDNQIFSIPLKDYGLVTNVTDNTIITSNIYTERLKNLPPDITTAVMQSLPANVYTFVDIADNGVLIDGQQIYPTYNNTETPSNAHGELSLTGCHVGQGGGGPHCHFDAYQPGYSMGIYDDSDYLSKQHPPLIGFSFDGLALFGFYRTSDTALLGASVGLDSFGGHTHDNIGYHLHSHTVTNFVPELMPTTTIPSLSVLMKGAYVGKANSIPYFRSATSTDFKNNIYLGGGSP
jgi:hypothetical protein